MKVGLSIQFNCRPTLKKRFVFRLVVFSLTVSMHCIDVRNLKIHVSQKFSTYFSLGGMTK